MDERQWLVERFEATRPHLRAVAYRMLGSPSEADDAVQEAWIRLSRSGAGVENLGGWLTTVVGRVCLDMLRSRRNKREEPLSVHVPDPLVSREDAAPDPEDEALTADSVGLALLVVLEMLAPAERLAFVLHDMFAVPFDEIATIVGRSPDAARQLASRARRRVQGAAPHPDADLGRQRAVVGDFDALVAVLDPDVVLRSDGGAARPLVTAEVRGAEAVAGRALMFSQPTSSIRPAVVNGVAGVVIVVDGRPVSVMAFTVTGGRIVAIDALGDPDRLAQLDLAGLDQ